MKTLLFILVSFIALTCVFSGLLMIYNPSDGGILNLPVSMLKETPFKNFKVPGLLLAVIIGGTNLLAVFFSIQRHPYRYNWVMAGGIMISGWIIVQMLLINAIHCLYFIYLGIGILIILLAYQLKGKWAV